MEAMRNVTNIAEQLRADEGLSLSAYKDTLGYATVGFGHKIELPNDQKSYTVTADDAETQLQLDIMRAMEGVLVHLPWFTQLDVARQGVLVNMAFQLGVVGLLKFHHFLTMLEAGNYEGASAAMLESLWAKQTPERSRRLSRQILTAVWQ